MTSGPFHHGELAVQQRAGVAAMASRVGNGIHPVLPPAAADFLAQRSWVVLATTDARGRPWASVVSGPPGFVAAPPGPREVREVRVTTRPVAGDPLQETLSTTSHVGLLAIDLATRRRMRLNGRLVAYAGETIVLAVDQVYANCPKYIQRRLEVMPPPPADPASGVPRATKMNRRQREWLAAADTFFVATVNPGEGADASHRGGAPGFLQVEAHRLRWPDYPGNMMFNTLGNIEAAGRAGLLVPDFQAGKALALTGTARIEWSGETRAVELDVEEVAELSGVFPAGLILQDYSPHLPAVELGATLIHSAEGNLTEN